MIIRNIYLFFLLFISLTGCFIYYPKTPDIPLISHKNDTRIDAGVCLMGSANMTVSYGLTNHIALQAYGDAGNRWFYHGAVGYFKRFGKHNVIEIYGGAGNGFGKTANDARPGKLRGHYMVYFTQFNIGKIGFADGRGDFGIGIKTSYLNASLLSDNYFYIDHDASYTYSQSGIVLEPMVISRFGSRRVKFSINLSGCKILGLTNPDRPLPYSHFNLGFGLNFRIFK